MNKIRVFRFLLAAALVFSTTAAFANDTIARVAAGGITFLKSDQIRMLEEILEISLSTIKVTYRFLNESDNDVATTVAFPMPRYRWVPGDEMYKHQRPITTFKAKVDRRSITTKTTLKAMIGESDVTLRLREIGLSDEQIQTFAAHPAESSSLTAHQQELVTQLIRSGKFDDEWTVANTITWEQIFPARKEVVVEHSYAPFVGSLYTVPYQSGSYVVEMTDIPKASVGIRPRKAKRKLTPEADRVHTRGDETLSKNESDENEACLDSTIKRAIKVRIQAVADSGAKDVWVTLNHVEYVLGTGRNWKGPIGKFTLRILKDSPDQLISLCFPGKSRMVNSTLFEFVKKDFVPRDRLVVYFYNVGTGVYGDRE